MLDNSRQFELRVTVNGKPIQEYTHDTGRVYVEGRKNSSFGLQFVNHTNRRVLTILSVDGLSIMDGEPAGYDSGGYVVNPWETINVPGWRIDQDKVAEFIFKTAGESYSNQMGKGTVNTGVIGCMVFKEKQRMPNGVWHSISSPWNDGPLYGSGVLRGASTGTPWYNGTIEPQNSTFSASSATKGVSEPEENLGTGFGSATSFNTVSTHFERENPTVPSATLALFYDSAKNLEKMGIRVLPNKRKNVTPNPFPQANPSGCTPPPGWGAGK